jgi:hypothetical protein
MDGILLQEVVMDELSTEIKAAIEYLHRDCRSRHPDGHSEKGSKWYPSDTERQVCCSYVREPSHAYPWSLAHHCRTKVHVEKLFGLEAGAISTVLKKVNLPLLIGIEDTVVQEYLKMKLGSGSTVSH